MSLALGMSIAPTTAAQPSPDVGRFYAFGGFALYGPETNEQLQHERGEFGLIGGGGFRFSPFLSFELGVLGAGRRLDTPASAAPAAGNELRRHRPGGRESGRQPAVAGLPPLFLISTRCERLFLPVSGLCVGDLLGQKRATAAFFSTSPSSRECPSARAIPPPKARWSKASECIVGTPAG